MKVETAERAAALEAIRRAGGALIEPIEAWATGSRARRQIFVSALSPALERGEPYDTWMVTLDRDGSAVSVERFRSTACRPSS